MGRNKILLIEDDRLVLESLENLLKREEYDITAIDDSLKAADIIKKNPFDLVITDIRMPKLNGIETIKKIIEYQSKTKGPKSEFIVITGYADDDAPKESALLGITNFMVKPFDSGIFLETVKSCLEGKKKEVPKVEEKEPQKISFKLPNKYFSIEKTVFLRQTNLMGNTYFTNYIIWQGEAREACLMAHPNFAEEMKKNQNVHMITHSLYHRFIEETTFGDVIEIRVTAREIKRCSFVMVFRYYNKRTGSFIGEGWQRVAFIDKTTGMFCPIPNFIRELTLAAREDISEAEQEA